MRHSLVERCPSGTCMGSRSELLENYSAELHALEELPSSKEDGAVQERRERLVAVVADIRYGGMNPVCWLHPRTGAES
jgi:hypothetical protein